MSANNPHNLTDKQFRFCHEYMVDNNATQAALRAGYAEKGAAVEGSRLLINANVTNFLSELQLKAQKRTGITADRVLAEYAKVAFFDIRKIYDEEGSLLPIQDIDEDSAAAIAGMETYEEKQKAGEETFTTGIVRKIKITDKVRALDSLGKHLGIFEKDNSQKKPEVNIDLNNLTYEQLKELKYGKPDSSAS